MQIKHGTMTLQNNRSVYAAVTLLDLPNFNQTPTNPRPGAGVTGTVTLDTPPHVKNFVKNDIVDYTDSNNNNYCSFIVTSAVGPSKYNITSR